MAHKITILSDDRRQIFDYSGGSAIVYIGKAHADSLTSEAKWQIQKLTYSGDNVTNIDFAEGNSGYVHIWDNRSTFDYTPDS